MGRVGGWFRRRWGSYIDYVTVEHAERVARSILADIEANPDDDRNFEVRVDRYDLSWEWERWPAPGTLDAEIRAEKRRREAMQLAATERRAANQVKRAWWDLRE